MKTNFIFCSLKNWFFSISDLLIDNHYAAAIGTFIFTGTLTITDYITSENIFGTSSLMLIMVMGTVFVNTITGTIKSIKQQKKYFAIAQKHEYDTKDYNLNLRKSQRFKYDSRRMYFVFFKCLSFLFYLAMIKILTSDGIDTDSEWQIEALNLTAETLIRVPIAIFWYHEFKSIGDNSEFLLGKKALPFKIAEYIFEPRILKMFGDKTPTDGNNDYNPPNNGTTNRKN
jgi:hypothetical protein